jgi:hypothetical protein
VEMRKSVNRTGAAEVSNPRGIFRKRLLDAAVEVHVSELGAVGFHTVLCDSNGVEIGQEFAGPAVHDFAAAPSKHFRCCVHRSASRRARHRCQAKADRSHRIEAKTLV